MTRRSARKTNEFREPSAPMQAQRDARWWLAPEDRLHRAVQTRVETLRERSRARREMYRFYAELYGTHELFGLGLTNYDPAHAGFVAPTLPYNVVRRGVNTLLAKVTKHKPLPMVLTSHGDYKQTKRARGLSHFLEGAFYALRVHRRMRTCARDALVFGTGILKVHHCEGDRLPRVERIFPWEIMVDVADARYGAPKQVFLVRWFDKTTLKELYPGHDEQIDLSSSSSSTRDDSPDYAQQGDMVLVTEAYRLPVNDGKRKVPGKWAVTIDTVTLASGEYKKPHFPLVFLQYAEPVIGFWGDGLAAEMAGFQYEVNYVVETVRMGNRAAGTGIWMVPDNCDVPDTFFENGVGMIMRHRPGFAPEYVNPTPVNDQHYQYLDRVTQGSLPWSGISSMSANAEKPAGITAAKALQTLDDIEADVQAVFENAYEELSIDLADHLIDEFKDIAEEAGGDLSILVPQKRAYIEVDWADVDMPRDAIQMQVWPTNLLGRTPAARLQMVNDLFNGGIIERSMYLKLLDAPDIDAETDLSGAMQEAANDQIEKMLDAEGSDIEASYQRPEPFQDLVYSLHRAQQHVCLGRIRGVPDENLALLRRYIVDCKTELDLQMGPPAPPQLAPAPIAPPGMGPAAPAPMMPPPGAAPPPPGPPPMMNGAA
jgi:hypothetical protein